MSISVINYVWFFIIYAFLGWWVEVAFHALTQGKFVNRGFLNGPVCPIYGFGMIILLYFLEPLANREWLLFLTSVFLTSLLEFLTGFVLEKIFHAKWWDYSDRPFNLKGYICLSFSILWGLGAVFVIKIIQPAIAKLVMLFHHKWGNYMLIVLSAYFVADLITTIFAIRHMNKRFLLLDKMSKRLRAYSDEIGESIYNGVVTTEKRTEKIQHKIIMTNTKLKELEKALRKDDLPSLKAKYNQLLQEKSYVHRRLEKAFPNIRERLNKHAKRNR